jgi:microcystin-dependent protein
VTLNVDGLGAKPLRFGPSLELQSGVLIQGTPYAVSYNNTDGAFYLQGGFANPYGIPLGGMMPYIGSSAPSSAFAIPIGQAISRTAYATLFSLVGTTFGVGDGSTTFNVPDLRGRAVFGPDSGGSGRITVAGGNFDGTVIGGTGGAQNKVISNSNLPADIPVSDPGHTHGPAGAANFVADSGSAWDVVGSGSQQIIYRTGATANSTTGIKVNDGSANTALPILPPAIVLPYILRII